MTLNRIRRASNLASLLSELLFSRIHSFLRKKPTEVNGKKILVFGICGMGDAIQMLPLLREMRKNFVQCSISIVASAKTSAAEVFQLSQLADHVLFFEFKTSGLMARRVFLRQLIRARFDIAFCTHITPTEYFLPALTAIPVRVGAHIPWHTWWKPKPNFIYDFAWRINGFDQVHETRRYLSLLSCIGIDTSECPLDISLPISQDVIDRSRYRLEQSTASRKRYLIGIHPGVGTNQQWKQWGEAKFIRLARRVIESLDANVILLGGPTENAFLGAMALEIGEGAVVVTPGAEGESYANGVEETAGILSNLDLFVGNDSGVGHLALACGIPSLRLFGMSDYWGYKALGGENSDIWKNLPCSPCLSIGRINSQYNVHNCHHRLCLKLISVDEVYNEIVDHLGETAPKKVRTQ